MTKAKVMSPLPLLQEDAVFTGGWGEVKTATFRLPPVPRTSLANSSTAFFLLKHVRGWEEKCGLALELKKDVKIHGSEDHLPSQSALLPCALLCNVFQQLLPTLCTLCYQGHRFASTPHPGRRHHRLPLHPMGSPLHIWFCPTQANQSQLLFLIHAFNK